MANLYTHGISCEKMVLMGIILGERPRQVDFAVVKNMVEDFGGSVSRVLHGQGELVIHTTGRLDSKLVSEILRSYFLSCIRIIRDREKE